MACAVCMVYMRIKRCASPLKEFELCEYVRTCKICARPSRRMHMLWLQGAAFIKISKKMMFTFWHTRLVHIPHWQPHDITIWGIYRHIIFPVCACTMSHDKNTCFVIGKKIINKSFEEQQGHEDLPWSAWGVHGCVCLLLFMVEHRMDAHMCQTTRKDGKISKYPCFRIQTPYLNSVRAYVESWRGS